MPLRLRTLDHRRRNLGPLRSAAIPPSRHRCCHSCADCRRTLSNRATSLGPLPRVNSFAAFNRRFSITP